jgi:hypothetical protein
MKRDAGYNKQNRPTNFKRKHCFSGKNMDFRRN